MSAPQHQKRYQPYPSQAEITTKYTLDLVEIDERRLNADDGSLMGQVYPGGNTNDNLKVYPGEIVLSKRESHINGQSTSRLFQSGFTSVNGLYYGDYGSMEAMMRNYQFGGFAKTEYEIGGDNMWGDDPLDHGFSVTAAGTGSGFNNGQYDLHAGDVLCWQFPEVSFNKDSNGYPTDATNNMPHTKILPEIVPFRRTDAKLSLLAIQHALERGKSQQPQPGIVGLTADDLKTNYDLSPLQEEALAMQEGFKAIFELVTGDDEITDFAGVLADEKGFEAVQMIADGLCDAMVARLERVIGKAQYASPKNSTAHVMLSHFKVA